MKEDDQQQLDDNSLGENTLGWALSFEAGLGLLALVCGYITIVWPAATLWPIRLSPLILGVVTAIPPLMIMLYVRRVQWAPIRDLTSMVNERLVPMFRGLSVWELGILSFSAGWGEELLFRGLIQGETAYHSNIWLGIFVASVAFGLVHFLSVTYFVTAFLISVYFGWLYWQFESLWVPIMAHAAYDFLMLLYLQREDQHSAPADKL